MGDQPIKTAGELRAFLADVLVGIRNGSIDVAEANAIAKVSGQINQSLSVEASTALALQRMGNGVAGEMLIAGASPVAPLPAPLEEPKRKWCDQCDKLVSADQAGACGDRFCKARDAD